MDLVYHRNTFELLGKTPLVSLESARLLEERQRLCGVLFPASFVEWYSIEGALVILSEIFDEDTIASQEWSEDVVQNGVLSLPGCSTQAGWHFIRINEGDDPTVFGAEWDSEPIAGPLLSDFIYTLAWDFCCDAVSVRCNRPALTEAELLFLSQNFKVRPFTNWGMQVTRRFQKRDWMLTILEDENSSTVWDLNAESSISLLAFVRHLSPLGIQANKILASHDAFKRTCPSCQSKILSLDERCFWCGAINRG